MKVFLVLFVVAEPASILSQTFAVKNYLYDKNGREYYY